MLLNMETKYLCSILLFSDQTQNKEFESLIVKPLNAKWITRAVDNISENLDRVRKKIGWTWSIISRDIVIIIICEMITLQGCGLDKLIS